MKPHLSVCRIFLLVATFWVVSFHSRIFLTAASFQSASFCLPHLSASRNFPGRIFPKPHLSGHPHRDLCKRGHRPLESLPRHPWQLACGERGISHHGHGCIGLIDRGRARAVPRSFILFDLGFLFEDQTLLLRRLDIFRLDVHFNCPVLRKF